MKNLGLVSEASCDYSTAVRRGRLNSTRPLVRVEAGLPAVLSSAARAEQASRRLVRVQIAQRRGDLGVSRRALRKMLHRRPDLGSVGNSVSVSRACRTKLLRLGSPASPDFEAHL